jgi:tRNA nucleotidyltransferase/poly(A) polymerase
LAQRQIRAASEFAFAHDPVRILRAIRQAADFGFTIEAQTIQVLREATSALPNVSPERQRDELVKLLNTPAPGQAVERLQQWEVLPHLLPEVEAMVRVAQSPPHYLDVFQHTIKALKQWQILGQQGYLAHRLQPIAAYLAQPLAGELTLQKLLPLALLLHDSGKPLTQMIEKTKDDGYAKIRFLGHEHEGAKIARQVLDRFHFSGQAASFVETVVAHHMRPLLLAASGQLSRRALYRFFRDTSQAGYEAGVAIALLALADHRATYPAKEGHQAEQALHHIVDKLLSAYFDQRDQVVDPPPLLTGQDLIKVLDLEEGPLIGLLLRRLKEAQASGQVNDWATALAFVVADPDFINYRGQSTVGGVEDWRGGGVES